MGVSSAILAPEMLDARTPEAKQDAG